MLVDYNTLPNHSKVWIYQANRIFTNEEEEIISKKAELFLTHWEVHGKPIKASYKVLYKQFIVFLADNSYNAPSGCSIDASVNFIKSLEKEFNINLTDKLNVTFKVKENINTISLADFKKYASEGKITKNTTVFNNLISTKQELETKWETKAEKSWHAKFLA